jgi:hypothetical protein
MKSDSTLNDVALVIRVTSELRDALKTRAAEEDRSVASVLRVAARSYLEDGGKA